MKDLAMESRVDSQTNKIEARKVQVYYGTNHAIKDVDVDILDKTVTAFIGPSGCGKSTFQRDRPFHPAGCDGVIHPVDAAQEGRRYQRRPR